MTKKRLDSKGQELFCGESERKDGKSHSCEDLIANNKAKG